jgi:microcystin-dependent protein
MAVITPSNTFSDVYLLDTTDPVKGGAVSGPVDSPTDGQANAQAQALANRTEYLFQRLLPIGTVLPYGGTTAPTGFLLCHGQQLSRTTYADLFDVIGTSFGYATGTTFFLPDLRGQFIRGWDAMGGVAASNDPDSASRTASGTNGATGNNVGSEQTDAFAEHDHGGGAHTHNISAEAADDTGNGAITGGTNTSDPNTTVATSSSGSIITSSGGNETRPTNIYLSFIIKATV